MISESTHTGMYKTGVAKGRGILGIGRRVAGAELLIINAVLGMCRAILGRPVSRFMQTFAPSNCFIHRGDKKTFSDSKKEIVTIGSRQTKGHEEKDIKKNGFSRPAGIGLTRYRKCSNLNADKIRTRSTL